MRGSRSGGTGDPDPTPLQKSQNIGFLSNTGPDPVNNHKATKPAFNVGPSSARHLYWFLDPLSHHQLKKRKRQCSTPSDNFFKIRA